MNYQTADGMFATNAQGKILFWNESAQEILGYQSKEVIGKYCWDIICSHDKGKNLLIIKHRNISKNTSQSLLVENFDNEVITSTGRKILINFSVLLISNKSTKKLTIVYLFRKMSHPLNSKYDVISPPDKRNEIPSLTHRENEVLFLMGQGLVTKEIADRLAISTETTRKHIQKILKKFKVHSKLEVVVYALKLGFLSL
ncbi:MAG: PAS domain-containing protein [Nitrospirae bacterium]|nr:PAS domain-containing protein [Nitrospirota bacterium]MBI3593745.1 PAS domain-containing protein [Nitrospirota bacterium]